MQVNMKDGGERVQYGKDGAFREPHRGKGRYDWISPFALRRLAFWAEAGGIKYGGRNWERGMPYEHPMDSLMRHTNDYRRGDRSEDHLAAIACNAFFLMHYQDCGMDDEFDTLPTYPTANTPEQEAINKARLCKIPGARPTADGLNSMPTEATESMEQQAAQPDHRHRDYKIIAVDFDGCLCKNAWPEIGAANAELINRLKFSRATGDKLILWTCREGKALDEAVAWCNAQGLGFDAVNANLPEMNAMYGNDSRKIGADWYLDDKAERVMA